WPAARPSGAPDELNALRATVREMAAAAEREAKQAYESGCRAGADAVRQSFENEVRAGFDQLAQAVGEIVETRAGALRRAEADTVRLALEIAKRILHRELSLDPSALEGLVRAAIEKLQGQEIYRVRVHPGQEAVLRSCLERIPRGNGVTVVPDPSQRPWSAVFEVSRGTLDASLDMQLREIERGLDDEWERRP